MQGRKLTFNRVRTNGQDKPIIPFDTIALILSQLCYLPPTDLASDGGRTGAQCFILDLGD